MRDLVSRGLALVVGAGVMGTTNSWPWFFAAVGAAAMICGLGMALTDTEVPAPRAAEGLDRP